MKETNKYNFAITAFAADFDLALNDYFTLSSLDDLIKAKNQRLLTHINLLCELDFNLRHGKVKILLVEEE